MEIISPLLIEREIPFSTLSGPKDFVMSFATIMNKGWNAQR
jgi:hypothetical protein